MRLRIWDVEHGACAMLQHINGQLGGRLAMIDSGCTDDWRPSEYIAKTLGRNRLDYLFITNADQDHMSDLQGLWDAGIYVHGLYRNPSYTGDQIQGIKQISGDLTNDARRYVSACNQYNQPLQDPFDNYMGGITARQQCGENRGAVRGDDREDPPSAVGARGVDQRDCPGPGALEEHGQAGTAL